MFMDMWGFDGYLKTIEIRKTWLNAKGLGGGEVTRNGAFRSKNSSVTPSEKFVHAMENGDQFQ